MNRESSEQQLKESLTKKDGNSLPIEAVDRRFSSGQPNYSLLSGFSQYTLRPNYQTFQDLKQRVIYNSNQLIESFSLNSTFNFVLSENQDNPIENIIYSTLYSYQEMLRLQVRVYVFAPLQFNQIERMVRLHKTMAVDVEFIVPIYHEDYWFALRIQNKSLSYYCLSENKDIEADYADKFQDKLSEQLNRNILKIKVKFDLSLITEKFTQNSFLVVLSVIFQECFRQSCEDSDNSIQTFVYWAINLIIGVSLISPIYIDEASSKIKIYLKRHFQNSRIQELEGLESMNQGDEQLRYENFCLFCITWPFKSKPKDKSQNEIN